MEIKEKFFRQFEDNVDKMLEVSRKKNAGYTAGTGDPFSNFRFASLLATLPGREPIDVSQTILSRMADKISRYKSLIVRPDVAYDEPLEDTLHDLLVYCNILLTWEQLRRPEFNALFPDDKDYIDQDAEPDVLMTVADPTMVDENAAAGIAPAGSGLAKLFDWNKLFGTGDK